MQKSEAIKVLGSDPAAAARAIGVTVQAVNKWPEVLPRRIVDRVVAAVARDKRPPELNRVLALAYGKRRPTLTKVES
jgi:hypothetical protein